MNWMGDMDVVRRQRFEWKMVEFENINQGLTETSGDSQKTSLFSMLVAWQFSVMRYDIILGRSEILRERFVWPGINTFRSHW